MRKYCSHILAPLTDFMSKGKKKKIEWTENHPNTSGDSIKKVMAKDTILFHPRFGEPYEYTNILLVNNIKTT